MHLLTRSELLSDGVKVQTYPDAFQTLLSKIVSVPIYMMLAQFPGNLACPAGSSHQLRLSLPRWVYQRLAICHAPIPPRLHAQTTIQTLLPSPHLSPPQNQMQQAYGQALGQRPAKAQPQKAHLEARQQARQAMP